MPLDTVVAAADLGQAAVPLLALLAYAPQWIKLWQCRSSATISIHSWCIWCLSGIIATFYAVVQVAVNGNGWVLVVSTILTLIFSLFTLLLVVRFRPGRMPAKLRG